MALTMVDGAKAKVIAVNGITTGSPQRATTTFGSTNTIVNNKDFKPTKYYWQPFNLIVQYDSQTAALSAVTEFNSLAFCAKYSGNYVFKNTTGSFVTVTTITEVSTLPEAGPTLINNIYKKGSVYYVVSKNSPVTIPCTIGTILESTSVRPEAALALSSNPTISWGDNDGVAILVETIDTITPNTAPATENTAFKVTVSSSSVTRIYPATIQIDCTTTTFEYNWVEPQITFVTSSFMEGPSTDIIRACGSRGIIGLLKENNKITILRNENGAIIGRYPITVSSLPLPTKANSKNTYFYNNKYYIIDDSGITLTTQLTANPLTKVAYTTNEAISLNSNCKVSFMKDGTSVYELAVNKTDPANAPATAGAFNVNVIYNDGSTTDTDNIYATIACTAEAPSIVYNWQLITASWWQKNAANFFEAHPTSTLAIADDDTEYMVFRNHDNTATISAETQYVEELPELTEEVLDNMYDVWDGSKDTVCHGTSCGVATCIITQDAIDLDNIYKGVTYSLPENAKLIFATSDAGTFSVPIQAMGPSRFIKPDDDQVRLEPEGATDGAVYLDVTVKAPYTFTVTNADGVTKTGTIGADDIVPWVNFYAQDEVFNGMTANLSSISEYYNSKFYYLYYDDETTRVKSTDNIKANTHYIFK